MPGEEKKLSDEAIERQDVVAFLKSATDAVNEMDTDLALSICKKQITEHPEASEPHYVLGVLALRLGDEGQGIAFFEKAHNLAPDCQEYAVALANATARAGKLSDSMYYAKLATILPAHPVLQHYVPPTLRNLGDSLASASPSVHYIEAMRLFNLAKFEAAIRECSSELRLNDRHVEAYTLLGRASMMIGRFGRAVGAFQAAIGLSDEDDLAASGYLARCLANLGRFSEAQALALYVMTSAGDDAEVFVQAMGAYLLCPAADFDKARELANAFEASFLKNSSDDTEGGWSKGGRGPTIGMLSNRFFFCNEARAYAAWFSVPVKASRWVGLQQSVLSDTQTTIFKAGSSEWMIIFDHDPYTLAYTLKAEYLDVIVDLSSLDGDTRQTLSLLNPCPIRIGTFMLPEPGMAPGITHVLTDATLAESDRAMLRDGQSLVILSRSLFVRQPLMRLAQNTDAPSKRRGRVGFGAVLDLARLTAECAILWAQVLKAVPGSRLSIYVHDGRGDGMQTTAREYFAAAGVVDRVVFISAQNAINSDAEEAESEDGVVVPSAGTVIDPAFWNEVDIFLDTTPINYQEETIEALWSGVPVVTLKAPRRAGLVGASILTAAGRPRWVADNAADFVSIATSLAADADNLAKERTSLQKNIATSSLFDAAAQAEELVKVLRDLATDAGTA